MGSVSGAKGSMADWVVGNSRKTDIRQLVCLSKCVVRTKKLFMIMVGARCGRLIMSYAIAWSTESCPGARLLLPAYNSSKEMESAAFQEYSNRFQRNLMDCHIALEWKWFGRIRPESVSLDLYLNWERLTSSVFLRSEMLIKRFACPKAENLLTSTWPVCWVTHSLYNYELKIAPMKR